MVWILEVNAYIRTSVGQNPIEFHDVMSSKPNQATSTNHLDYYRSRVRGTSAFDRGYWSEVEGCEVLNDLTYRTSCTMADENTQAKPPKSRF